MDKPTYEHYQMQQGLQQQNTDAQAALYAPQTFKQQDENRAVLVDQTNPDKVVETIILSLKGLKKDMYGQIVKYREPVMNDLGIGDMEFLMRAVVNQNTILSHLDEQRINNIILRLGKDIVDALSLNWKEYGIKDKALLSFIDSSILIPCYMALQRAWEQNEKNWLGKISVENISNAPKLPMPKRDGFWSKFRL